MLFNTLKSLLYDLPDYNLSCKGELLKKAVLADQQQAIELASFTEEKYCRQIIHRVKDFDVVLIGWLPGQSSPVHNHPTNGCIIYPIKGELTEERYCEELNHLSTTKVGVEEFSYIDNGICIHKLGNASDLNPAISVHIYSPSNFTPKIFKENSEKHQLINAIS